MEKLETREINIYSTSGAPKKVVKTKAVEWGELTAEFKTLGIQFDNMTATIGETSEELNARNAKLPSGSFNLFLLPMKVNSGSVTL